VIEQYDVGTLNLSRHAKSDEPSSDPTALSPFEAGVAEASLRAVLGNRVREARTRRNLTGKRLAELADVTPGFISQIERGQVAPSFATLARISHALGIRVGDLFDASPPAVGRVLRPEEWPLLEYQSGNLQDAVLAIDPRERFEVVWSRLAPGATVSAEGNRRVPETEFSFVLVLRGQLELKLGGERHLLDERCCIIFPATVFDSASNPTAEPTEYLGVVAPAVY
jgi:transcriptional regulator with XRE-family HTH domain